MLFKKDGRWDSPPELRALTVASNRHSIGHTVLLFPLELTSVDYIRRVLALTSSALNTRIQILDDPRLRFPGHLKATPSNVAAFLLGHQQGLATYATALHLDEATLAAFCRWYGAWGDALAECSWNDYLIGHSHRDAIEAFQHARCLIAACGTEQQQQVLSQLEVQYDMHVGWQQSRLSPGVWDMRDAATRQVSPWPASVESPLDTSAVAHRSQYDNRRRDASLSPGGPQRAHSTRETQADNRRRDASTSPGGPQRAHSTRETHATLEQIRPVALPGFAVVDRNHDGVIDRAEFAAVSRGTERPPSQPGERPAEQTSQAQPPPGVTRHVAPPAMDPSYNAVERASLAGGPTYTPAERVALRQQERAASTSGRHEPRDFEWERLQQEVPWERDNPNPHAALAAVPPADPTAGRASTALEALGIELPPVAEQLPPSSPQDAWFAPTRREADPSARVLIPALETLGVEVEPHLDAADARRTHLEQAAVAMSSLSRRKGDELAGENAVPPRLGGGLQDPAVPLSAEELDHASAMLSEQFGRARDSVRQASPHKRVSMSDAVVVSPQWQRNAATARSPTAEVEAKIATLSTASRNHSEFVDVFLKEKLPVQSWDDDDDPDWFLGDDESRRREVARLDESTGVRAHHHATEVRSGNAPYKVRHPGGRANGAAFDEVDRNGDGVIDRAEWLRSGGA